MESLSPYREQVLAGDPKGHYGMGMALLSNKQPCDGEVHLMLAAEAGVAEATEALAALHLKQNRTEAVRAKWLENEEVRLQTQGKPTFFNKVDSNEASREELAAQMLNRYQLSFFFNDYLAKLLETLGTAGYGKNHPLVTTLAENLAEELGTAGTEYGNFIHENSRAQFIKKLGVDYTSWASSLGSLEALGNVSEKVKNFYEAYLGLLKDPVKAYAALAYWEWRVSRSEGDYTLFLKAFEKLYSEFKAEAYVPGDALWHLYSHSVHDDEHAAAFFQALEKTGQSDEIIAGFTEAAQVWDVFWA